MICEELTQKRRVLTVAKPPYCPYKQIAGQIALVVGCSLKIAHNQKIHLKTAGYQKFADPPPSWNHT